MIASDQIINETSMNHSSQSSSITSLVTQTQSLICRMDKISVLIESQMLLRKLHEELENLVSRLHNKSIRGRIIVPHKGKSHSRSRSKEKKTNRHHSMLSFSPEEKIQKYSRSCKGSPKSMRGIETDRKSLVIEQLKGFKSSGKIQNEREQNHSSNILKKQSEQYYCLNKLDERSDEEDESEENSLIQPNHNQKKRYWKEYQYQCKNLIADEDLFCMQDGEKRELQQYSNPRQGYYGYHEISRHYSHNDVHKNQQSNDNNSQLSQEILVSSDSSNLEKEEIEQLSVILKNLSINIQNEVSFGNGSERVSNPQNTTNMKEIMEVEASMDFIMRKIQKL